VWALAEASDPGGVPANVWWFLGIVVTTAGTILGTVLLAKRPERTAPPAAEPVAVQTARDAVEEYRQMFMQPLREETDQLRERLEAQDVEHREEIARLEREVQLAQRAQASAERDLAAANAELTGLRPAFQKALRDLAEERRRRDDE